VTVTDYGSCYLCGLSLTEPIDWDHVPMKQLYAPAIRRAHSPQLLIIPVHADGFQKDEDYFVHALMPYVRDSHGGECCLPKDPRHFPRGRQSGAGATVRKLTGI
jgi:hypothetical protein